MRIGIAPQNHKKKGSKCHGVTFRIRRILGLAALTLTACGGGGGGSSGEGTVDLAGGGSTSTVAASRGIIDFGEIRIGQTSGPETVTLANTGSSQVSIENIGLSGPDSPSYSVTHDCGASLAVGGSCSFSLRFAPPSVAGTKSATLQIQTSLSVDPSVTLTGVAVGIAKTAMEGYWYGAFQVGDAIGDYVHFEGITTEEGKTYFVDEFGDVYSGTLRASGANFSGNLVGAALLGYPYTDGGMSADVALSGLIKQADDEHNTQWLDGNFTLRLGDGTQFAGPMTMGYEQDLFEYGSSFEKIAGTYLSQPGPYQYNDALLNIASNGELFLQDPTSACVLNGRVRIINELYNAYDFELVHSSCTDPELSPFNGVTFRGLAFYDFDNIDFTAVMPKERLLEHPSAMCCGSIVFDAACSTTERKSMIRDANGGSVHVRGNG